MRPFQDWKIYNRSEKYCEVCKEDLKNIGNDDESFLLTRCGMLMQGFIDGAYYIFIHYKALSASSVNELKPFCITEDISFIQMARIFVHYYEKNLEKVESDIAVIQSALRQNYPCPWQIEHKRKK